MSEAEETPRELIHGEITLLLHAWRAGDQGAMRSVFAALYETLHGMAHRALSGERAHHTFGPAGLVSEAFFRMLEQQRVEWRSREHFLATAAQVMRRVLVDYVRHRRSGKRGGTAQVEPLTANVQGPSEALDELVRLHDALEALAAVDRSQSEIVQLRFFGGMTHDEIARHLALTVATVERRWRVARAWLFRELAGVRDDA